MKYDKNSDKVVTNNVNVDTDTGSSSSSSSTDRNNNFYTSSRLLEENNSDSDSSDSDSTMFKSMKWNEIDRGSIYTEQRTKANKGNGPIHIPTKLPLPIFVMNMPKSGSTTIHQFFSCGIGKLFSVHHTYNKKYMDQEKSKRLSFDMTVVASCLGHNLMNDKPLIDGCGGFSVWTDAGSVVWDQTGDIAMVLDYPPPQSKVLTKDENDKAPHRNWCFYPGVHALDNIGKYYPYATILHLPRNSTDWVRSSTGWSKEMKNVGVNDSLYETSVQNRHIVNTAADGKDYEIGPDTTVNANNNATNGASQKQKQGKTLLDRYELKCNGFGNNGEFIPPKINEHGQYSGTYRRPQTEIKQKTNKEWMDWYDNEYTTKIRNFAMNHPTLTYFESPLDDPLTPVRLEKVTGISSEKCFGHHLKTADRLEQWKQKNRKSDKDGGEDKDDKKKSSKSSKR